MKKKGFIGRLAAVAVVLCLITMSLTSGTLAKYASEASGNATATVAKWAIKFTDGAGTPTELTTNFTLNLEDTAKETANLVADNKIAPGTTGSFKLEIDGTGTEVAFHYSIQLNMSGDTVKTAPIKFYSNEDCTTELSMTATDSGIYVLEGDVLTNDSNKKSTQTIYWKWNSSAYSSTSDEDTRDTEVGVASAGASGPLTYTIPVTIKAEQLLTAPSGT